MVAKNNKQVDPIFEVSLDNPNRQPTLTVWPSGDTSIGFWNPEREDDQRGSRPVFVDQVTLEKKILAPMGDVEVSEWWDYCLSLEAEGRIKEAIAVRDFLDRDARKRSGLSDAVKSHKIEVERLKRNQIKARAGRGSLGISAHGKKMLKSAAVLLEEKSNRRLLTFATCTVPRMPEPEAKKVNDSWPEITRRFVQELRRELKRNGLPLDFFGCSEVQPKRYERTGEIGLHLHFCFVGRKHRYSKWLINHEWFRHTWGRILQSVVDCPLYLDAATEARGVEKSAKNEVGKYLSKGGELIDQIVADGRGDELPKAYWIVPFSLRREVKGRTLKSRGRIAKEIVSNLPYFVDAGVFSLQPVLVEASKDGPGASRRFLGGFTGWVRDSFAWDLLAHLKAKFEEEELIFLGV